MVFGVADVVVVVVISVRKVSNDCDGGGHNKRAKLPEISQL